jgi:hypothetical protein
MGVLTRATGLVPAAGKIMGRLQGSLAGSGASGTKGPVMLETGELIIAHWESIVRVATALQRHNII